MEIQAILPGKGRDLRLDLFRGVANWAIYLDHIPDNVVNWITTRNYGFSDAADLFVFISGYTASFVYAKMMLERGFIVGGTRLTKRVWQLYVAHIVLFVIYIVAIGYVAVRFSDPDIINEFNVAGLVDNPIETLRQGLLLKFKPVNLDVLPLYIVLMGLFPPVLWLMLRKPDAVMIASFALYFAARHFDWNLPGYPGGTWYFNPFCWQLLFVFGAWCALGGTTRSRSIINSSYMLWFCIAYMVFALVMTMAGRFPTLGEMFPTWLFETFNPNDKTNLAPYRFLHFAVLVVLVVRFVPKDWKGLESPIFDPLIKCGQQSLAVFCVGVFLSFVGHFELMMSSGSLLAQIIVSVTGIALMTLVAYYITWSKKQDKPLKPAIAAAAPAPQPAGMAASAATVAAAGLGPDASRAAAPAPATAAPQSVPSAGSAKT
ncbi:OpgC domain-containing protein [Rhodopseudomonas palustris]|uniref:OpgC domain-containing protein n=1 Tax=Rhodopseudomonas palustris TaxID=1076 RepID=UPI002ACD361E|nr:OpgC domain-containing protein [Rhodopseudomonas palustris]WQH00644.1 OpgC domain-containing protein [Rhodopseudomonas palustris]